VGPGNHVLIGGSDPPMGRGNFEGEGRPIVTYRDTMRSSVQKRLNDTDAVWFVSSDGPKELCVRWGPDPPWKGAVLGEKGHPL